MTNTTKHTRGFIPPQAISVEEAVIGALLIDSQAIFTVMPLIKNPDVFYKTEFKYIYRAIAALVSNTQPIDMLTVSDQLRKDAKLDLIVGEYEIARLSTTISSTANLKSHCLILVQQYIKRSLIAVSEKIIVSAHDESEDALELLSKSQVQIDEINKALDAEQTKDWQSILDETTKHIDQLTKGDQQLTGVPTGLNKINETTGGWQGGQLIVLAGRPGMGKTAMMIKHISAALHHSVPVAVFSLEMTEKDIAKRLIVGESKDLHANQLFRLGLTKQAYWDQYLETVGNMEAFPVHIQSKPGLALQDLVIRCRELKHRHNIGLIVIDYLQLMSIGANNRINNREQEISTISRKLKALALELDVPIIALSQLSREVEKRGDKRPKLADLRESGAIEQDADVVSFLFRPEYYDIEEYPDGEPTHNRAEYIVEKQRNGPTGTARIGFDSNRINFFNLEDASPKLIVAF